MRTTDAVTEVRKIARRSDYSGELSEEALVECAEVYAANCTEDGVPSPRRYMRSGDGHKPTNLSEMQWLLVRTPSFRRWFGNSVVVDENGDPKVMYHGTWKSFSEFKTSSIKMSKSLMTLWTGPGFYFSDKEKVAKIYAGGNADSLFEVFLRLEKPLIVDETGNAQDGEGITKEQAEKVFLEGDNTQWLDSGLASELARMDEAEGVSGRGRRFYKEMSRAQRVRTFVSRLKTDVVKLKTASQAYGARSQNRFFDAVCRHTGHDGVIHTLAPGVKEWVVYDPKAIKSATDNSGDFSTAKAKVEDSSDFTKKASVEKGTKDMGFRALVETLTKIVGNPSEVLETGMDIVDRNGRHHQPKAIPEGGQFEEEGKYAATATAKEEWFHKTFAENKKPQMKKMRDFCADILSRIDSSKLGNDTAVSDYKKQIHKYADMPKASVIAGMKQAWDDMKKHADTYNEIKGMSKEEFAGWLKNNPEYNSTQMQNLMENKAYGKTYKIKNAAGEYEDQDHAAWEEAKMMIGRRAVGSLVDYMAHTEALHNTPDGMIDSFLKGKGKSEKHKLGYEDYEKTHGIKHGEGEHGGKITMSEINAAESELSKAINEAKTDPSKTSYFHSLSHFLGKDGGMRDPNATVESIKERIKNRIDEKVAALQEAKKNGNSELIKQAEHDLDSANFAAESAYKILGKNGWNGNDIPQNENNEIDEPVGEPKDAAQAFAEKVDSEMGAGAPKWFGENVPTEKVTESNSGALEDKYEEHGHQLFYDDYPEDVKKWLDEDDESSQTFVSEDGNLYKKMKAIQGAATQHEPKEEQKKEPKNENKGFLTEYGKKLYDSIGSFLNSDSGKKYVALANNLTDKDKSNIDSMLAGEGIDSMLDSAEQYKKSAAEMKKSGETLPAKKYLGYYIYTIQKVHSILDKNASAE